MTRVSSGAGRRTEHNGEYVINIIILFFLPASDPLALVWKPGEEAWVKSFDLVSTGDIVRPGSKSLTHG